MKIYKTTPTDATMFNRYLPLVSVLFIVSIAAQIISATTEASKVYAPIYSKLSLITDNAVLYTTIITILAVAVLEIGIRVLLPYAARSFIYRLFTGPDKVISILVNILAAALLVIGCLMSFNGSSDVANNLVGDADTIATDSTDSLYAANTGLIEKKYLKAKSDAEIRADRLTTAATNKANAEIKLLENDIQTYKSKEERTGQSFKTAISRIQKKINKVELNKQTEINQLTIALATELKDLSTDRDNRIENISSQYQKDIADIKNTNDQIITDNKLLKESTGTGLGYLTIIMQLLVLIYIVINEMMQYHSGIKSKVIVGQSYFEEPYIVALIKSIGAYLLAQANKLITYIQKATPDTAVPVQPPTLINHSSIDQQIISVEPLQRKQIGYNIKNRSETFIAHEPPNKPLKSVNDSLTNQTDSYLALPKSFNVPTLELWQLKQRLKAYKKKVGSHTQKAIKLKAAGQPVPKRTIKAIANNKQWVKAYENRINELLNQLN